MKYYDIEKVEALLMEIGDTHDEDLPPEIVEAAAALRSSACEVEAPSGWEVAFWDAVDEWARARYKPGEKNIVRAEKAVVKIRAALSRFGQQGAGAEAARRYSEGKISAGKFGELLGLEPGELHDFKTACGAFDEKRHMELIGQPRGRCRWTEDSDSTWETACGKAFVVSEGRPDENGMLHCCYCGGRIEQMNYADMLDENGGEGR